MGCRTTEHHKVLREVNKYEHHKQKTLGVKQVECEEPFAAYVDGHATRGGATRA